MVIFQAAGVGTHVGNEPWPRAWGGFPTCPLDEETSASKSYDQGKFENANGSTSIYFSKDGVLKNGCPDIQAKSTL